MAVKGLLEAALKTGGKAVSDAIEKAKYDRSEFDPRFYPGKKVRVKDFPEKRPDVIDTNTMVPYQRLALQDLVGRPYLTTMSDRIAAGGILEGIGNKPLAHPLRLTGGQDYMRENPGKVWASAEKVVPDMEKAANELKAEFGQSPVFLPWRMTPSGGDFAHLTGQTMLSWAAANMPKGVKKQLDKDMKQLIPDWAGVDDPKSLMQYGNLKDTQRKAVMNMMDVNYRNQGGISRTQARLAVADQSQLLSPVSGFQNVGEIDLSRGTLAGQGNPTYPFALAGEYKGTLDTDVTAMDLNPQRYARKRKKDGTFDSGPQGPDYLSTREAPRRAMEVGYWGGLIDEPLLRTLSEKGFKVDSPAAVGLLSGAGALAALAPQEAEAAPAGLLRQAAPVAMTGLLGAGMSEDSDASILGSLSKLGAGRQDLLGMAQKMANEGMDVQSIRERTGWEIGADGQWRTELPNTNTKINIPEVAEGSQYYTGTIADVIDDPELLSQYEKGGRKPTVRDMEGEIEEYGSRGFFGSLGDIAFTVDKNMPEGQGFHREGYFDEFGERQPETIVISGKSSPAEQRATLLHELQHSIQDREGFAAGGNQRQFAEEERIKDSFYERVGLTPAGSGRLQELEQKISDVGQRSMSLQEMSDLERLRVEKQISDRFNADTVGEAGARSPYGMYKGLMGEVEARNVETRDKMKPDFLRATPLELSEDVFEPRSQQIFRAGSDDELFRELEYLKNPDFRSNSPEYREAPVVQEQSFGDMVNEYANINQRAQAAEAQKFGLLMREDARLRDMGSAAFGQVSPELAAYRRSQILPTIGEMGMGALEGAVDTVDFVSQLPTAISTMTMPKRTPLRDRLGGLLDYSFVDERDQRARDEARLIGGLLSPI